VKVEKERGVRRVSGGKRGSGGKGERVWREVEEKNCEGNREERD